MTKQPSDETILKCPQTAEEDRKVVGGNAMAVCNLSDSSKLEEKLEVTSVGAGIQSKIYDLGTIVAGLYDLEGCVEKEKPLKIDLDLYQMEDV